MTVSEDGEIVPILQKSTVDSVNEAADKVLIIPPAVDDPEWIEKRLRESLFARSLQLHQELNDADLEVAEVLQQTEEARHKANAKRKGIRNKLAEVLQELYPGSQITIGR